METIKLKISLQKHLENYMCKRFAEHIINGIIEAACEEIDCKVPAETDNKDVYLCIEVKKNNFAGMETNSSFEYKEIRGYQDCSALYEVVFNHKFTVKEFINEVVNKGKTWGKFYINNINCIHYKHAELIDEIPEEYANCEIVKATCYDNYTCCEWKLTA